MRRFHHHQGRLKGVKLEHQDYQDTIEKYDGVETFFYLDPWYTGLAPNKECEIDLGRLLLILMEIKGKFLLSFNDVPIIREKFNRFYSQSFNAPRRFAGKYSKEDSFQAQELLIANYPFSIDRSKIQQLPRKKTPYKQLPLLEV